MAKRNKSKLSEWQKKGAEGGVCESCKRHVPRLSVDHIVPKFIVEMIDDSGEAVYEDERNFRFLCFPCNTMKGNCIDKSHPMTAVIIKDLMNL